MNPLSANLVSVALPATLVIIAVVIVLARRGKPAGDGLSRAESIVVSLVGVGAMLSAAGCLVLLGTNAVMIFSSEPFQVQGLSYAGTETPDVFTGNENVLFSGYASIWALVRGLPVGPRWLFYAELALPVLTALVISVAVAWLALSLRRGRPFARDFPVGICIAALAVMVGGIGSQFAGALARSSVVDYLGGTELTGGDTSPHENVLDGFVLQLELAPVGWALGLVLVAAAFQIGARLQHEAARTI